MNDYPTIPLAERMRPTTLDNYIGQEHLVGGESVLRKAIKNGNIPSMIFWGPPGVGKTTLATIISHELNRQFYTLSAINSGVKDIREVIEKVKNQGLLVEAMPSSSSTRFTAFPNHNKTHCWERWKRG